MELGAFSISLSVQDLDASMRFYEALGFATLALPPGANYAIMKNGETVIGLFQGMFEGTMLTFNPGWDQSAEPVDPFTDVRVLQRSLKDAGIAFLEEADESSSGPASFVLTDPDGNVILVDQHR
jgi:catechol 2,3-dioxygenase-like lactoylglutathione lyase family enzyme